MTISARDLPRPAEIKTYHTKSYPRISPTTSGHDSKGKTVFVTGGSIGIGFAICRSFAAAGVSKLIIASRTAGPLEEAKQNLQAAYPGLKVETHAISIEDFDALTEILQSQPIDILVLNAFYSHQHNIPSTDVPASEIQKTLQVNVVASYHIIATYIKAPPTSDGTKTILAVSSAAAHIYIPQQVGYSASKIALSGMISRLALEHAPQKDGVKLVSFHPGVVYTKAAEENYPADAFAWEDDHLPGDFTVWLAGKESNFLHGSFVWAQWDVDDLIAAKGRIDEDGYFLKMGLVF